MSTHPHLAVNDAQAGEMAEVASEAPRQQSGMARPSRQQTVEVAEFRGLAAGDAVSRLRAAGLLASVDGVESDDHATHGVVIDQEPEQGKQVGRGALVTLYVSQPTIIRRGGIPLHGADPAAAREAHPVEEPWVPTQDAIDILTEGAGSGTSETRVRRRRKHRSRHDSPVPERLPVGPVPDPLARLSRDAPTADDEPPSDTELETRAPDRAAGAAPVSSVRRRVPFTRGRVVAFVSLALVAAFVASAVKSARPNARRPASAVTFATPLPAPRFTAPTPVVGRRNHPHGLRRPRARRRTDYQRRGRGSVTASPPPTPPVASSAPPCCDAPSSGGAGALSYLN